MQPVRKQMEMDCYAATSIPLVPGPFVLSTSTGGPRLRAEIRSTDMHSYSRNFLDQGKRK